MERVSSALLKKLMEEQFPPTTTSWSKATDEVRDMCREARLLAGVDEALAVNFRQIDSPAEWNRLGIAGTVRFYDMLDAKKQQQFCALFEGWLVDWQAQSN